MRKWLAWLLTAAMLLSLPAMAAGETAQDKSWDVKGERIYNLQANNGGIMTVVMEGSGDIEFDGVIVLSANWLDESMRGTWSVAQVGGDAMDLSVLPAVDLPAARFLIKAPQAGKTGVFDVIYASDSLKNTLHKLISVTTVPSGGGFADDFAYKKTEHQLKTGYRYEVEAPELLPRGADVIQGVEFGYDDSSFQPLWDAGNGYVDFDYSDGSFAVMIGDAGTYTVTVDAVFTSNVVRKITHTFTVTGAHADHELPDYKLWAETPDTTRVYDAERDNHRITYLELVDGWGYENDQFEWSVAQTKGETVKTWIDSWDGFRGELYVEGEFPVGKYAFTVTLKDLTRGESSSADIDVEVEVKEEKLLEDINYPKLKKQMTIKAGQTLDFGAPVLMPSGCVVAPDTVYGLWTEEDLGEARDRMLLEDHVSGRHKIVGVVPGVYHVHAWVNMFGDSRGAEFVFELTVQDTKTPVSSLTLNQSGTWENPYRLEVGKTLKLKAAVLPKNATNKSLTWKSDYPEGVTVSAKGVVKGLEAGAATEIHAYTNDGSNLSASIVVEIVHPKATKLTMNKKKLSLKVGGTATLSVKFKPANLPEQVKRLAWLSDNTEVAEVVSGLVIAKTPGKATIYAYGSDSYGYTDTKLFAKCVVTVK